MKIYNNYNTQFPKLILTRASKLIENITKMRKKKKKTKSDRQTDVSRGNVCYFAPIVRFETKRTFVEV